MGLVEQCDLLPGSKVYCDNLFTSVDLLDHMSDKKLGVTSTLCLYRLHGVPLPSKKEVEKNF
jgi:hypothetical protein